MRLRLLASSFGVSRELFRRPRQAMSTIANHATCDVECEPLHRYTSGGYHPVHLHDKLHYGRYTILHKLGWGGFATVWLAKDEHRNQHVAVKIMVSEIGADAEEARFYDRLSRGPKDHPGKARMAQLIDSFIISGPNGRHACLVTELLGLSAAAAAEQYRGNRLPGEVAWQVARQLTQALAYVHEIGLVHGDIHPGNVLFTIPESDILKHIDKPVRAEIHAMSANSNTIGLPKYMIQPASLPQLSDAKNLAIKLIDFGSSFNSGSPSPKMRCPLPFRAPEAVLMGRWDTAADIWSLASSIFAFVVGYPPFDAILAKESDLVADWVATFGSIPEEWNAPQHLTLQSDTEKLDLPSISEWLHETYYDNDEAKPYFVEGQLNTISQLILSLFRLRPEERPSAQALIQYSALRDYIVRRESGST